MMQGNTSNEKASPTQACDGEPPSQDHANVIPCVTSDFVAAVYEGSWYIGQVKDIVEHDAEISVMQKRRCLFQWPTREDVIWVDCPNVLCKVKELIPYGKSKKMFKLDQEEQEQIEMYFCAR